MLQATNIPAQVVTPQNNVLFSSNAQVTNNCVTHNEGSGNFSIKGSGLYLVIFQCNVNATAAGQVAQLAIRVNGETVNSAYPMETLAAIGDLASVCVAYPVYVPCGCSCNNIGVSVANVSAVDTTVQNASITFVRISN